MPVAPVVLREILLFVGVWFACAVSCFYAPQPVDRGMAGATASIIYGGFGIVVGPVLAAAVVYTAKCRRRHA